jgi:hypothetical protein
MKGDRQRRAAEHIARINAEWAEASKRKRELADIIAEHIVGMERRDIIDAIQAALGGVGWNNMAWENNFVRPETLRLIRQLHARLIAPADLEAAPIRLIVAARELLDAIPPFALSDDRKHAWPCVKQAAQAVVEALDELELEA